MAGGSPDAAKFAAAVLLMEMERDPYYLPTGHYNFDRMLKALQLCFTSGVVDDALLNRFGSLSGPTLVCTTISWRGSFGRIFPSWYSLVP